MLSHWKSHNLQTWASRKPRRLRLDGQGRDVERSRLADEGAELASVRLQRLVRKGERLSRDVADGALSRRTEVRLGRESPGTRPHAGQGDGRYDGLPFTGLLTPRQKREEPMTTRKAIRAFGAWATPPKPVPAAYARRVQRMK